jgi:hypothetical protein
MLLPKKLIRTGEYTNRTEEYRTDCVRHSDSYVTPDLGGAVYHLLLRTLGGQCPHSRTTESSSP